MIGDSRGEGAAQSQTIRNARGKLSGKNVGIGKSLAT